MMNLFPSQDVADIKERRDFLAMIARKWSPLRVELTSSQTMMGEALQYWTRYTACQQLLTVWLDQAEATLQSPNPQNQVTHDYTTILYNYIRI